MTFTTKAGVAKVRLDERGRAAIPVRYRERLAAGEHILTAHPHQCLVVYSTARFAQVEKQIAENPSLDYNGAHLAEILLGHAETLQLDAAGRVALNAPLREFARIERDVLLFDLGDCVRIWDEARWQQKNVMLTTRLQEEGLSEEWKRLKI